ncbi:MAG: hypothetical protein PHN69_04430 [Candidatus Pacebacteria bacterium]|nr:hypothetical protein [Candidatus Paceibacterota bacterium]
MVSVLLSGCITASVTNSDKAITQEDRQWIFNNNNDYTAIHSIFNGAQEADMHQDYHALQDFGVALTSVTDKSMQRSLNTTLSPGLRPAQRAWDSTMRELNNAGWELIAYGNSHGDDTHYYKCLNLESEASDCYSIYRNYL